MGLSLGLHGVGAAAGSAALTLMTGWSRSPAGPEAKPITWLPAPSPPQEHPPDQQPLRLGIAASDVESVVWIGFETREPGSASLGTVEQAGMTLEDPGVGGKSPSPAQNGEAADAVKPIEPNLMPVDASTTRRPDEALAKPEDGPAAAPSKQDDSKTQTQPPEADAADKPGAAPVEAKPPPEPPEPAPSPPPDRPPNPTAAPAAAPPAPPTPVTPASAASPPPGKDHPGHKADKEADAMAIVKAVDYRNGKVQAGKGLDIKTRRPDYTKFTRVTAWPRNALVQITFDRRGRVGGARILQSSGYRDVDEPILNAVWEWTASGKEIDNLPKDDPEAGLTISIRFVFRR